MRLAPLPKSRRAADAEPHITSRTKLQKLTAFHPETMTVRGPQLFRMTLFNRGNIVAIDSDRCRAAQATALAALQLRRRRPDKLRELPFFFPARARTFCA